MALFTDEQQRQAEILTRLGYGNPFMPERIELERQLLGGRFVESGAAWHKRANETEERANIDLLTAAARELATAGRQRLEQGETPGDGERDLYENAVLYYLYNKYEPRFFEYIKKAESPEGTLDVTISFYGEFQDDMTRYYTVPNLTFSAEEADHIFACFYQLRRAFHSIFDNLIGGSMTMARLRAAVWQSIFTCDMRRYRRALYKHMRDVTTLVTGPSGTGKELVARAIALSQYIPFDGKRSRPTEDLASCFRPVNLSALSPTLIESELFGHTKGSFTGATADRVGFLEVCPPSGTVFLDEIGELDPAIQVKLLRVLQNRTFQRIGDTTALTFRGKVVAATNRDLGRDLHDGRFRPDLYYRLCADTIVTPPLREQIKGAPEQLANLLRFIARNVAGPQEAEALADEVEGWIEEHLGPDYPWPGNVRELEQCVRNILVRRHYQPLATGPGTPLTGFLEDVRAARLTADELLEHYCTLTYAYTGSYQESARRLGVDRRTVKSKVRDELLELYRPR